MNLAFSENEPYLVFLMCWIGWFLIFFFNYKTNSENEKFNNFIYFLFADPETPVQNFLNSLFVIGLGFWIIRLIYTILYGFQV